MSCCVLCCEYFVEVLGSPFCRVLKLRCRYCERRARGKGNTEGNAESRAGQSGRRAMDQLVVVDLMR